MPSRMGASSPLNSLIRRTSWKLLWLPRRSCSQRSLLRSGLKGITCLSMLVGVGVEMEWRVDLHHHRQVYETCAPLFVLRHRNGASRSARTFVSSSSGKRLCYLSYRGEIGTPGQS